MDTCSYLAGFVVFQADVEHHACNVNMGEKEEHFSRCPYLPATVKNRTGRIFRMKPQATQRTSVPLARMYNRVDWQYPVLCLRHNGLTLAKP